MEISNIRQLSPEDLSEMLERWPWFTPARVMLTKKSVGLGALDDSMATSASIHIGDSTVLRSIFKDEPEKGCIDPEMKESLKQRVSGTVSKPRIIMAGGDYFSAEDYESVRRSGDRLLIGKELPEGKETAEFTVNDGDDSVFCTETLARIYAEQEYYSQAIQIYSKLILAYPEKSAYFANLIDQLKEKIKN